MAKIQQPRGVLGRVNYTLLLILQTPEGTNFASFQPFPRLAGQKNAKTLPRGVKMGIYPGTDACAWQEKDPGER